MATPIDLLIIFATSFGFNLIPFAGPSNLLIASTAAIGLGNTDPLTMVIVGVIIAFAAALAKGIHYMVTFFVSSHLSQKRQARLHEDANKVRRWAFPLLFIAAASPIPDEPIVIPLGLMKYNPVKFFSAYFLGKLTITVAGVFLGGWAGDFLEKSLGLSTTSTFILSIVVSIILTVAITVILLKVDLDKLLEKYLHRKPKETQENKYKPSQEPITEDKSCPPNADTP
ncbi:MAG TPA: VTT domain-containing protein [Candidatus Acidoferrales bacterium]|nr:VTT domain-containing protein [Candidatus Acidoferrales bacterium]